MLATPRASFILLVYNQEAYIEEAFRAALAQDCEPIEILISDDCSKDRTWEIIQKVASGYAGPHLVTLNQNAQNMGVNPHLNACIAMAKGDIHIAGSGDDISYPDRVARVLQVFDAQKPLLVHARVDILTEQGVQQDSRHTGIQLQQPRDLCAAAKSQSLYIGATASWSRELFDIFGPVPNLGVFEDLILGFRASLLDRVGFIDAPLVAYRTEVGISKLPRHIKNRADWIAHRHRELTRICNTFKLRQVDAQTAGLESTHPAFAVLDQCLSEAQLRLDANDLPLSHFVFRHGLHLLKALRILVSERLRMAKNLKRSRQSAAP